jgi:hypothetical protein
MISISSLHITKHMDRYHEAHQKCIACFHECEHQPSFKIFAMTDGCPYRASLCMSVFLSLNKLHYLCIFLLFTTPSLYTSKSWQWIARQ